MGSFDRAMLESRLGLCEKYKKATESDLLMFQRELDVEVFRNLSGSTATLKRKSGISTDVKVVNQF